MTTTWMAEELELIESTDNVGMASRRADGSLRRYITIWVVRVRDEVYIRSAYGPENPWFVRAKASGRGRLKVAGQERDVTFEVPGAHVDEDVSAAYRAKYERHPPRVVATVVSDEAARCTLRLVPA
jgi:hypothetical protein